ncbi:hypothetical protein CAEBREN_07220 [Caenorhabditis brenneri]|uniref:Uncharacterized protein n=1 Tax=Caenorhabditis brenneri TaxID=135651 RepID=G0M6X0_CAEBE|nr:hypothetical protein CAEBREN_07220 [Caenorhabditis brenneri]
MITANTENIATRKVRELKSHHNTPRRKSLGGSILQKVRKSLGGTDLKKEDIVQLAERLENAENVAVARETKYRLNEKSMQFNPDYDNRNTEYMKIHGTIDTELAAIGGMIALHQYCYEQFKMFKFPIHRDGANFFREADIECFFSRNQNAIRMAYLKMIPLETVEEWCRDYYSRRDLNRHEVVNEYYEDRYTTFDGLFDEIGRDVVEMVNQEMLMMENYCAAMFKSTSLKEYQLGVEFWRKASPLHLPRNYQLALILTKRNNWDLEIVEKWFQMFYTEKCWSGARCKDVYPNSNPLF